MCIISYKKNVTSFKLVARYNVARYIKLCKTYLNAVLAIHIEHVRYATSLLGCVRLDAVSVLKAFDWPIRIKKSLPRLVEQTLSILTASSERSLKMYVKFLL